LDKELKIDLTESESAGKADPKEDKENKRKKLHEKILKALEGLTPASLLRKIGGWHNHLSVEIAAGKAIQNSINEAIFDDSRDLAEVEELEKTYAESKQKLVELKEHLHYTYSKYDEQGHYKDQTAKVLDRKLKITSIPASHDHVCGGLSGGANPRLCCATECKVRKHLKSRYGVKYEKALFLVMNSNLLYPVPICRKDHLNAHAYLLLADAEMSIRKSWNFRKSLVTEDKEVNDETAYSFLKVEDPVNLTNGQEENELSDESEDSADQVSIIEGMEIIEAHEKGKNPKSDLLSFNESKRKNKVNKPSSNSKEDKVIASGTGNTSI
jgi:hypothetical protein